MRVLGGFAAAFGAPGETPWIERVQYLEIVPAKRLVMQGLMTQDGKYVTFTRYAIDLTDLGTATELTMLETGGDPAAIDDRAGGWGGTLDNLGRLLA